MEPPLLEDFNFFVLFCRINKNHICHKNIFDQQLNIMALWNTFCVLFFFKKLRKLWNHLLICICKTNTCTRLNLRMSLQSKGRVYRRSVTSWLTGISDLFNAQTEGKGSMTKLHPAGLICQLRYEKAWTWLMKSIVLYLWSPRLRESKPSQKPEEVQKVVVVIFFFASGFCIFPRLKLETATDYNNHMLGGCFLRYIS